MAFKFKIDQVVCTGKFITHGFGYYSFELTNKEVIIFDEINDRLLKRYNLKDGMWRGKPFEITYSIITEILENEEFVVLRLDDLEFITTPVLE